MRLFVALWPSPEAIGELATVLADAVPRTPDLRWVGSDQWHVTLAFLGEVADPHRPELERRLTRVATRYPPVALRFAGGGRFGDRVLLMKVSDENATGASDPLRRLADSVRAAARRADLAVDDTSFRAHVTLARARPQADLRPLAAALRGFSGGTWTATEIHLVRSRLGAGPGQRPVYETVAAWPLTGRPR